MNVMKGHVGHTVCRIQLSRRTHLALFFIGEKKWMRKVGILTDDINYLLN